MGKKKFVAHSRVNHVVKPNYFEKKINRSKNVIFGKKKPKIEFGSPGYSRHQGFLKRKRLLLSQLKKRESCNSFSDKRIGQYSEDLNEDDRLLKRFAMQRKVKYQNEDMSLCENTIPDLGSDNVAKLDSLMDLSSDDDRLDATESHFGGGFLKLSKNPKSRQEIMENVIASSKQKKYESQLERAENSNLLAEVENEWNQMRNQMNFATQNSPRHVNDNFDVLVKELAFDTRSSSNQNKKSSSSDVKKVTFPNKKSTHQTHHSVDELNPSKTVKKASLKPDGLVYNQEGRLISESMELNSNELETIHSIGNVRNPIEDSKQNQSELEKAKQFILDYLDERDKNQLSESGSHEISSNEGSEASENEAHRTVETTPIVTLEQDVHTNSLQPTEWASASQASNFFDGLVSRLDTLENKSKLQELLFDTCDKLLETAFSFATIHLDPILLLNIIKDSLHQICQIHSKFILQFFLEKLACFRESISTFRKSIPLQNELQNERMILTLHFIFSLFEMEESSGNFFIKTALSLACELFSNCTFHSVLEVAFLLFLTDSIHSISNSILFLPEVLTLLTKLVSFFSNSKEEQIDFNSVPDALINSDVNRGTQWNFIFSYRRNKDDTADLNTVVLFNALALVHVYSQLYSALPCFCELFSELTQNLKSLRAKENMPDGFLQFIDDTLESVDNLTNTSSKTSLQLLRSNLKSIKFLEPESVDSFSKLKYNSKGSNKKNMMKLYKKEYKGAVMEIRKDNAFLSREHFRTQKNSDTQRNKDVKGIEQTIVEERNNKSLGKKKSKF